MLWLWTGICAAVRVTDSWPADSPMTQLLPRAVPWLTGTRLRRSGRA